MCRGWMPSRGGSNLKKLSPNRFQLEFTLKPISCQACVVTLVDVPAHIERHFLRELHLNPALRRRFDQTAVEEIALGG